MALGSNLFTILAIVGVRDAREIVVSSFGNILRATTLPVPTVAESAVSTIEATRNAFQIFFERGEFACRA